MDEVAAKLAGEALAWLTRRPASAIVTIDATIMATAALGARAIAQLEGGWRRESVGSILDVLGFWPRRISCDESRNSAGPLTLWRLDDAIELIKATLPADTTLLADVQVDSNVDTTVGLAVTVNTSPADGNGDFQIVLDAIADSFDMLGLPQEPIISAISYTQGAPGSPASDAAPSSAPAPASSPGPAS